MATTIETSKAELIKSLKQRVEDGIIEQANADLIIKMIEKADSLTEAINIAELGTTYKRTGFHFDKRLEKMGDTIKFLKKNEALSFTDGSDSPRNILIIGDNYDALQNLLVSHEGMVDVIYIDPPYGKDYMGDFADTNYDNAITRDNLLSMLYTRLVLARNILSRSGVILVSIDDRNQAYVKGLLDEVFGESNCLGTIVWKKKTNGNNMGMIPPVHDFIFCYAKAMKDVFDVGYEVDPEKELQKYSNPDNDPRGPWDTSDLSANHEGPYFPITNPITGEVHYPPNGRYWVFNEEEVKKRISDGRIIFGKSGTAKPVQKVFASEKTFKKKRAESWWDNHGLNEDGTSELTSIFDQAKVFVHPKPVELIKNLVEITCPKDGIVLDFFAGSGTTGHSVALLNTEDGGSRTFILCTNNEESEKNPNGIAIDVTTKRLKRVMTGRCYDGSADFTWIKENAALGGSLDVYDIESVANFEQGEGFSPFDVIDETAYGLPRFEKQADKIKWICENFDNTQKYLED